ncbi:MAG: single-stranded DNA-binding protein [Christensenellales bacterium]
MVWLSIFYYYELRCLVSNLTRDPELRKIQSDISVCTFSVACNRGFTNAQGEREADFIPVVVWCALAENCHRFLKKAVRWLCEAPLDPLIRSAGR